MDHLRLCFLLALAFVAVIGQVPKVANAPPAPVNADPATDTTLSDVTTKATTGPDTPATTTTEATTLPTMEPTTAQPTKEPTTAPVETTQTHHETTPTQHTSTDIPTTSTTTPAKPEAGTWNVTDSNNTLCLKLTMSAQFTYNNKTVSLPKTATVDESKSSCHQDRDLLVLTWEHYTAKFDFGKGNETKTTTYKLSNLTFDDGKTKSYLVSSVEVLSADLGYSYKCNHEETVTMSAGSVNWQDVQVQAFMDESHATTFGTERVCSADDTTSDIVPIAVGCALIALVIIVLIAYIVGRRISRQKGYQSV